MEGRVAVKFRRLTIMIIVTIFDVFRKKSKSVNHVVVASCFSVSIPISAHNERLEWLVLFESYRRSTNLSAWRRALIPSSPASVLPLVLIAGTGVGAPLLEAGGGSCAGDIVCLLSWYPNWYRDGGAFDVWFGANVCPV